jgi:hypothetical protein
MASGIIVQGKTCTADKPIPASTASAITAGKPSDGSRNISVIITMDRKTMPRI